MFSRQTPFLSPSSYINKKHWTTEEKMFYLYLQIWSVHVNTWLLGDFFVFWAELPSGTYILFHGLQSQCGLIWCPVPWKRTSYASVFLKNLHFWLNRSTKISKLSSTLYFPLSIFPESSCASQSMWIFQAFNVWYSFASATLVMLSYFS